MKSLWLGLFPVIVFWFFEEKFGTLWGLVAAIVWAVGECIYEYLKTKTVDKLTLMSTGLVVVLGGVSLLFDQSLFFKFSPVITELIFAIIIFWQSRQEEGFLMQMAKKSNPKAFSHNDPQIQAAQRQMFKRMSVSLCLFLIVHSLVLGAVAVKGTTGQWAFLKGIGFYVLFGVWFAFEFLWVRFRKKR